MPTFITVRYNKTKAPATRFVRTVESSWFMTWAKADKKTLIRNQYKTYKFKAYVRPVETVCLFVCTRAVRSQFLLCTQRIAKDPVLFHAESKGSDQIVRVRRLTWVFFDLCFLACSCSCVVLEKRRHFNLTHIWRMDFSILINWTSLLSILWGIRSIFIIISFYRNSCKQTV